MARVIVSTVGMSLLLNSCSPDLRQKLNKAANSETKDISEELFEAVTILENRLSVELKQANESELKKRSAELNGLLGFYQNGFTSDRKSDIHFLVCTDTFLGETAGKILENYLKSFFTTVEIEQPKSFSTLNRQHFDEGIKELLVWCDKILREYRQSGYEIVFNLTGSFKSLQGYLNTFGMFYADKIIYIFETGNALIEIPKLPISIDENLFRRKANIFAQLANDHFFETQMLKDIPNMLLEEVAQNSFGLSTWGLLSWNSVKEKIFAEKLLELPFIEYAESFIKEFNQTVSSFEKMILQETLIKVSCLLQNNNGDVACLKSGRGGGLLYDNFSGKHKDLGHFRINQGDRVSCQFVNGKLRMRHFGHHDYVNDNP